ncbi:MAG: ribosome biogenesis GTPase Der [Gammaproteobacteria bacterium]|nr:ribosome biogenesis GTPase Der [Gammaproteobacteria bacterium]
MLPVIALVGRPNVGKSTLFNVLTRTRDALVANFPGLTRDRKYGHGLYQTRPYIVIDTGGLSGESEELDERMAQQTLLAIEEANIVLFLVDARDGLTAADEGIARQIRKMGKTVHLVINKIDGMDLTKAEADFYTLGFSDICSISASHGRGVKNLVDALLGEWQDWDDLVEDKASGIRVAVVGKPNVGKSTLINRITGEERVVVMDMPGTTRDSIFVPFEHNGKRYTLIDTAGVRRRKKVKETVEKFSVIKTLQAIDQSNVAVLMIDARESISDQDLHLLSYIVDAGKALVIAINKWDGLDDYEKRQIRESLEQRLDFIQYAEIFFISALHGSNVGLLYKAIDKAYNSATKKLSTPELTRILDKATSSHQLPLVRGRRIKLRYAHQGGQNPPVIVIHGNQTDLIPASYKRYLMNFFIDALKLKGTPMRLEFKTGDNPFSGRKNAESESYRSRKQGDKRQNKSLKKSHTTKKKRAK